MRANSSMRNETWNIITQLNNRQMYLQSCLTFVKYTVTVTMLYGQGVCICTATFRSEYWRPKYQQICW